MHYFKHIYIITTLLLLLIGCGSSGSTQTFTEDEKAFVYKLFTTEYLWYDQVDTDVDTSLFKTPDEMVEALRVDPPDHWSFSMTKDEYESFVNQETSGFGFGYTTSGFQIYLVRIGAPAWGKLQRGDTIVQVNHQDVTATLIHDASEALGTPATFTILRQGESIDVTVTPDIYTYEVTDAHVLELNGTKIGFMRYDAFSGNSVAEIEAAFTTFKEANIDELVIDMRYNGGGDVSVASILLDNILSAYPGQEQFYLDWNDNYKYKNESYAFDTEFDGNELNMSRVTFLVTQNSASASELVISALKPYLGDENVITIGENTHGKNVGMSGRVYGEDYYFLINFYVRNSDGETTPFEGIPPTCEATDDLNHLRGDSNETMLSTALYYLFNHNCPN